MRHLLSATVSCVVLASLSSAVAAAERTWTDYEGTKIKARFLTITDGVVRLRQDRKPIAIPFHQLCKADREFIRAELIDRGEPHLVPTIGEPRQWTCKQETFEAQFVGPQEKDLILLRNERPVLMPFTGFSPEDQEYVRQALVSKGQAHLVPQAQSGADGSGGAAEGHFGPAAGYGSSGYGSSGYGAGAQSSYSGGAPGAYGSTSGAGNTYSGSVPTYHGSSAATPSYSSGGSGSYGGSGTPGSTNPYGASGIPGYNPSGNGQMPSWNGADSATGSDFRSRIPDLTSSIPAFEPPSIPQIEYYKYCQRCGKRYSMSADYCTECSGGVGWRRYGVFGAIIGAVAGIAGAVIKAMRS